MPALAKIFLLTSLLAWPLAALGDEPPPAPTLEPTEPMVVTATATATAGEEEQQRSGRSLESIDAAEAEQQGATSVPEALEQAGVHVQRSSQAGGAPILRGLVGPQVLILIDGVRLNHSLWRTGPVQYLNALELGSLEGIELLRGPGSSLWGSDALGGVVQLRTRQPRFVDEGFDLDGRLSLGYRSASQAPLLHGEFDAGGENLAVHLGGDLAEYGLLRGGRDTGLQDFTGYRRGGLDATLRYRPRPGHEIRASYLGLRQLDVPRPDQCSRYTSGHLRDCRTRLEQFIDLAALRYQGRAGAVLDRIAAQLSVQNSHELRERLRWDRARLETGQDDVLVLGGRLLLSRALPDSWPLAGRLSVGGDLYHDLVESQAWQRSIRGIDRVVASDPGAPTPGLATAADGATYTALGGFAEQRLRWGDLALVASLRYSGYLARAEDPSRLEHALDRAFAAPSASLSGEYALARWLSLGGALVHGFRAPNLYDLTGRDRFGGGWEFADADHLGAERLSGVEALARSKLGPLRVELSGYASLLHDLIVRQPGTFAGAESFEAEPVFKRVNAGLATLLGVEISARLQLPAHSEAYARYAYTHGQDHTHDEPLSRIPPPQGTAGLRSQVLEDLLLGVEARGALAQERLSARDRADTRIAEEGTPGYLVVDLLASYRPIPPLRLSARLHNLFDASYRVHGSAIDGPGVEGQLRVELLF